MTNVHEHYDKLTDHERVFVDEMFKRIFREAKAGDIHLVGDDRAEVAVDALAQLIIESRTHGEREANEAVKSYPSTRM